MVWRRTDPEPVRDPYRYGAIKQVPPGSFEKVLKNIDQCICAGVHVSIRINCHGDREQIVPLLDILADRYAASDKKPDICIAPLCGGGKSIPVECIREVIELNEILIQSGLMTFSGVYSFAQKDRCFAATPWGFTIMPDGTLVNCSHNASAENSCGTVRDHDLRNELHRKFLSNTLSEDCLECPLLPVCGGGCPAAQYQIADLHQCISYRNMITEILSKQLQYTLTSGPG